MFRFGTLLEKAVTCLGVLLAFTSGSASTLHLHIMGEITTAFVERTHPPTERFSTYLPIISTFGGGRRLFNRTYEENMAALLEDVKAYTFCTLLSVVMCMVLMTLGVVLISWSAMRQITRIRMLFLKGVLRQDMSWFDTDKDFNLASKMSDDMSKLRDGIGEKLASVSNLLGSDFLSVCVAFSVGWKLSLACGVILPLAVVSAIALSIYQTKSATQEMESYSQAGKHAEETLKSIKTVVAFGGEREEASRYSVLLKPAERYGRRRGLFNGLSTGFNWVLCFAVSAICISYGARLVVADMQKPVEDQNYVIGSVLSILGNIFQAAQVFTMCIPFFEVFATARVAATSIFQIIDRKPWMDSFDGKGTTLKQVIGDISFENVHFSYPARPDIKILDNFSLSIKHGECVALVGSSGCGKSTVLHLLQRLYEPAAGAVKLDGRDLKDFNLRWLRSSFGVVGQEPVLFRGTIFENIAIGRPEATLEDVQRVTSMANAHEFIKYLPKGYETVIGERGGSLSGGQKQRIAVARALLRDPTVLLLDEPTSALDPRSEQQVQAALDHASVGRTTVVVSHRLATIVNANRIICMEKGAIVEQGTHEELMKKKGVYHRLVTVNNRSKEDESAPEDTVPSLEETQKERQSSLRYSKRKGRRMSRVSNASTISLGRPTFKVTSHNEVEVLEDQDVAKMTGWQIMKLNAPEWVSITIGSIAAFVQGSCFSIFGLLLAYFSEIFILDDETKVINSADLYAGLFIVVAVIAGLCMCLQSFTFMVSGLKMTSRLRLQYYTALLKQEIGFYDKPSNTVGALCSRLSGDIADVQSATGVKVGIILQGISSVFVAVCMGLFYDWRLTLVLVAFLPLIIGSTWLEYRLGENWLIKERKAMESAVSLATEAIISVRTVQSLGIEEIYMQKFQKALYDGCAAIKQMFWWRGLVMSICLNAGIVSCVACYYYGTILIIEQSLDFKLILLVSESVVFAAVVLGQSLLYSSSFNSVNISTARIISVINREPLVRTQSGVEDKKDWSATGNFSLKKLEFAYPTRKQQVLKGIDLDVAAGKTVALVGPSGCGKSTILQLMQRFYNPDSGAIELDGVNGVTSLTLRQLRQQLGVVQQELELFDRSLAENIAYGDNSRQVDMSEIIAACEAANIHTFIASLPQGYATSLGAGGAQLSGGQKQRVCIARALVRAPRLLLLDEATSALDAASERVVSEALDKAAKDRTCVMIAHRLSTVQGADLICVVHKGKIVERGNHEELIKLQGLYYQMCKEQNIA